MSNAMKSNDGLVTHHLVLWTSTDDDRKLFVLEGNLLPTLDLILLQEGYPDFLDRETFLTLGRKTKELLGTYVVDDTDGPKGLGWGEIPGVGPYISVDLRRNSVLDDVDWRLSTQKGYWISLADARELFAGLPNDHVLAAYIRSRPSTTYPL